MIPLIIRMEWSGAAESAKLHPRRGIPAAEIAEKEMQMWLFVDENLPYKCKGCQKKQTEG
jgi:hypothetical protein